MTPPSLHQPHDVRSLYVKRGMGLSRRLILGKMPEAPSLAVDPTTKDTLIIPRGRSLVK